MSYERRTWVAEGRSSDSDFAGMRAFVGVTDTDWFRFLSSLNGVDEVNFWQPGPHGFKALDPGEVFLFKLHYPDHFIAGGGFYAGYSILPCGIAWDAFGHKNGAETFEQMLARITHYRKQEATPDTEVGCILLEQPFFFPRDEWIEPPKDWSKNIVVGKTYDLAEQSDLWEAVQYRLLALSPETAESDLDDIFTEAWVRQRMGQGTFRALVTQTYERRCAVTREKILPVLQAAHIMPVSAGGQHRIENGLLLRSDIHTLFDRGYLTVAHDHRLRVSGSLRDDYDNGEYYLSMSGTELWLPARIEDRPMDDLLEWHQDKVFRG